MAATSDTTAPRRQFPLSGMKDLDTSAVGRVFEVAELLEKILAHLPFLYDKPSRAYVQTMGPVPDFDGIPAYSEPKSLFGVVRVCQQFRDTIDGSDLLKRLMFLIPLGDSYDYNGDTDQHHTRHHYQRSTLHWFCDVSSTNAYKSGTNVYVYERGVGNFSTCAKDLGSRLRRSWRRPEASWRRVRVIHYLKIASVSLTFRVIRLFDSVHTNHGGCMIVDCKETRVFEGDKTLGYVYGAASELANRGLLESSFAMAEQAKREDL